jgi:hypothetical protein
MSQNKEFIYLSYFCQVFGHRDEKSSLYKNNKFRGKKFSDPSKLYVLKNLYTNGHDLMKESFSHSMSTQHLSRNKLKISYFMTAIGFMN